MQGPLSRFGDTAANTGTLALLEDADIPPAFKTIAASLAAGCFRIFLMPVDALKTIMQVSCKQSPRSVHPLLPACRLLALSSKPHNWGC